MCLFVGGNFLVMAFCAFHLVNDFTPSGISWPWIVAGVVVGYFVADFGSGLVHWGVDTWFDERSLGRVVAIAREHHTHPQNIIGYGFLEHSALGSGPSGIFIGFAAIVTAFFSPSIPAYLLMIVWFITSTCLFFGTSFHNLCHKTPSRYVRWLQKMRLVIRTEEHWTHHRGDQTIRYCVINGWANYPCDRWRVWRGLEWLVHALTGAEPRRDDLVWQRRYKETGTLLEP
jgi:ubiquitin-conjugating enzyme E2 variant